MSSYASQTVTQLKDILKSRGLPINGVKADLIVRLEESDQIDAELDDEEDTAITTTTTTAPVEAETAKEEESAPATTTTEEHKEESVAAPVAETDKAADESKTTESVEPEAPATTTQEPKKTITLEELKAAAIDFLTKKIARAKKFGNESELPGLEGSLKRIEKFGISFESSLAKELGYGTVETKEKFVRKPGHFKNKNKNKNRNNRR
ncbi:hypothetical protein CANARDRAFT_30003 [[Candida] arabinofermentans NRRL YB-2248]|uniref:SAP domain-containing protein n=1 Tax=[Candida] arabinofermentans NRRL YB-2248 TaxID=983967 RepID=A0A1E4SVB2_9ASCO|nr:hypothetical protein CANARDRAFT_30003 [[Candida] arabinofermentans NRRL YB-2248]